MTSKPKPNGMARARKLLGSSSFLNAVPTAEEVAAARKIIARVNGAKGGKSRSRKKLAALAENRKKRKGGKK